MADELQIRAAANTDVPAIQELVAVAVQHQQLLPRSDGELAKLTENGFIAEVGSRVVGFCAVEVYSRKMAELQCLAVSEECRGKGVGRQLVRCCVDRAKELGIHELMAITASEKLFVDCGFDYSLPGQKRALFIHPHDSLDGE